MSDRGAVPFTRSELEAVLDGLESVDSNTLHAARALFDQGVVSTVASEDLQGVDLPEGFMPYQVVDVPAAQDVVRSVCALGSCAVLNGTLARHRALVGGQGGHEGLRCSHGDACGQAVCPFALAACFQALDALGSSVIPLYSEASDVSNEISRFRRKWADRLIDSDVALNLLLSRSERDFSGVLVVEDDSYLDGFIADVTAILMKMDKIDKDAVQRRHITAMLQAVNVADATFHGTNDEHLAQRQLYLLDRISDFFNRDPDRDFAAKYLIERFGHIVDGQYLILVGTRAEIDRFLSLAPPLEMLLGEHRFELVGMSAADLYRLYLRELDAGLRETADAEWRERFIRFVEFNQDIMPFHGAELADYLAKTANAAGVLTLPTSRYQSSSLDEMLDSIVGLEQVKRTIVELESFALFSKRAKGRGCTMPSSSLHMVFSGNAGTGKTTVARIIATMLYKIGIIPQNKLVEVTSKDLIGRYVGHTDKQVFQVVQSARGGVLFIDEAYSLMPSEHSENSFQHEALAELVKLMEDYRDDLVVILAGYEREMDDLIDSNPGLASRIGYRFHFEDFTSAQLIEIFRRELAKSGMVAGSQVEDELRVLFRYFRGFKNFGNGRFVREVLRRAVIKHASAARDSELPASDERIVITVDDIPTRTEMLDCLDGSPTASADEKLGGLIGLDDIKEKVRDLERVMRYRATARMAGMTLPDFNLHMVFTGNPGCGKTTIARIIGDILFNIGAVPTNRFVEIEAKDLCSRYVGQITQETAKVIDRAAGGVLFIDEAYALMDNPSGAEALAVLVKAMEERKSDLVVMYAGYPGPMRRFLDANPGMNSRIGYTFSFEDYTPEELERIFEAKADAAGLVLSDEAKAAVRALMKYFHRVEGFGNGRFADRVLQEAISMRAKRPFDVECRDLAAEDIPTPEQMCKLTASDVYDPSDVTTGDAMRRVAVHEAGHALCRLAATGKTDIVTITIEQEGTGTLGYVQHERSGSPLATPADVEGELACLLGGMAAERALLGSYSSGNSSDLAQATRLARAYVASWGMSDAGLVQYVAGDGAGCAVQDLPPEALRAMNAVLDRSLKRADAELAAHRAAYDAMVDRLLSCGTLSGEEITEIWRRYEGDASPDEANGSSDKEGR